ncbi:MAG: glycosyltransferase [Alphaproteobacteria bacterium]|nr:glycosyltransferase [Alphaproteobacteria bacterium]
MPTKTPRVSVLTPIYNTNPVHLRECIESILNQTYTDFEFLILNDSPDNKEIEKIVLEYASRDKRIKYSKNDKNMGISISRNKLLQMARGEYLAIFDHDDISIPTRLEQEVNYLDEHPYIGAVSSWVQEMFDDGTILMLKHPEKDMDIRIWLMRNNYFAHTACMLRKSVLDENNIHYQGYYSPAEDYKLVSDLIEVTELYNIQEALVKYRCSPENTSNKQSEKMCYVADCITTELRNKYPEYWKLCIKTGVYQETTFRLRLFGKIPLIKIKNNWVYLFEFIPVLKIRWN